MTGGEQAAVGTGCGDHLGPAPLAFTPEQRRGKVWVCDCTNSSSQELLAVAVWMMVGGAILTLFGVAAAVLAKNASDRGGLSKPLAVEGVAIFIIGAYLDNRWDTPW